MPQKRLLCGPAVHPWISDLIYGCSLKKKKSSFGFVARDDRVNTAAYIILKLWIISKIKLMVIAGVFSSSLKFSVNPLLAVYFPSSIHVAALILFGPAEVPEQAESNLLEKCIESWSEFWRHD